MIYIPFDINHGDMSFHKFQARSVVWACFIVFYPCVASFHGFFLGGCCCLRATALLFWQNTWLWEHQSIFHWCSYSLSDFYDAMSVTNTKCHNLWPKSLSIQHFSFYARFAVLMSSKKNSGKSKGFMRQKQLSCSTLTGRPIEPQQLPSTLTAILP